MIQVETPQLKKEIAYVENLLATRKLQHLKFARPDLENSFKRFYREHTTKLLKQNFLISLVLSLVYTFFGAFVVPKENIVQWLGLYLVISFGTMLSLFACYLSGFRKPERYLAFCAFISMLTILAAFSVTPESMHQVLLVSALMICFSAYASTLIPFKLALCTCTTALALSFLLLGLVGATFDWKTSGFIILGGNILGASLGYLNEYLLRKSFLQRCLLTLEKRHLRFISRQFETQSLIDALTNIANRRHFNINYKLEWLRCFRNQQPLSLIFIDIDYYKKFNDHYGHQMGDTCLKNIAKNLENLTQRSGAMVSRYGGEEFIVLLPDTNRAGSVKIAKRIQARIREISFPHATSPIAPHVTLSMGIATTIPMSESGHAYLIESADKALYQAKANGRNQWVIYKSHRSSQSFQHQSLSISPEHTLPVAKKSKDPIRAIKQSETRSQITPHYFIKPIKSQATTYWTQDTKTDVSAASKKTKVKDLKTKKESILATS